MSRVLPVFVTPLPAGTIISYGKQLYTLDRYEPGPERTLAVWASHCADCGAAFEQRAGASLPKTRRCTEHRNPGAQVLKLHEPAK